MVPAQVLAGFLTVWMVLKIVFIEVVIPQRTHLRHTRDKAAILAALVPINHLLYLFKLKDEGIMFYFGRPVLRLAGPAALPPSVEPLFCILTEDEWQHWPGARPAEVVGQLQDAQGAGLVLVCVY